jgi:hypothetical protein
MAAFCSRELLAPVRRARREEAKPRVIAGLQGGVLNSKAFGQLAAPAPESKRSARAFRVDDGQIEPRLGAVIQENRIDHFARAPAGSPNETFEMPSTVLHIRNISS